MLKHFFRHQFRRRLKPLYLGIDWQVDDLRLVLLGYDNLGHKACKKKHSLVLGQWHLSLPMLLGSDGTLVHPVWQSFITQLAPLVGTAPIHINVGIPNRLCTWLHCPKAPTAHCKSLFTLQLYYQRMAATALNIEPVNLRVCHLELSSNLSFLVVTKRRYDEQISQLLGHLHNGIKGNVAACAQPQGLTQIIHQVPSDSVGLDDANAMAWYMASQLMTNTPKATSC